MIYCDDIGFVYPESENKPRLVCPIRDERSISAVSWLRGHYEAVSVSWLDPLRPLPGGTIWHVKLAADHPHERVT